MMGQRPISTVYVFKAKPNADGTLERLKARICARGFLQKYGTDFLQTFAPVARLSTIRLQVAISSKMDTCLFYILNLDNGDENVTWVYELYSDTEAMGVHSGSDTMAALFGAIGDLLDGAPELIMTTPVAGKGL